MADQIDQHTGAALLRLWHAIPSADRPRFERDLERVRTVLATETTEAPRGEWRDVGTTVIDWPRSVPNPQGVDDLMVIRPDEVDKDGNVTFTGPQAGERAAAWLMTPEAAVDAPDEPTDIQTVIAAYLTNAPEQGDWEWEDHCEGMASGIVSELRAVGLLSTPATVLWTGHTEVSMGDDLVNAAGDSAIDLALPVPPGTHVVVTRA